MIGRPRGSWSPSNLLGDRRTETVRHPSQCRLMKYPRILQSKKSEMRPRTSQMMIRPSRRWVRESLEMTQRETHPLALPGSRRGLVLEMPVRRRKDSTVSLPPRLKGSSFLIWGAGYEAWSCVSGCS